jgi:hypothetical protein
MRNMKRRVALFRAGLVPPGAPTLKLVDDLWQEYERVVKQLRKISVPANDVGSSCFRCGARWSEGKSEHHADGCVLEGTEPRITPELVSRRAN